MRLMNITRAAVAAMTVTLTTSCAAWFETNRPSIDPGQDVWAEARADYPGDAEARSVNTWFLTADTAIRDGSACQVWPVVKRDYPADDAGPSLNWWLSADDGFAAACAE